MFPWGIAKSAENMLSRFVIRRVCKFLLKKKLGQFILGDIDLDQLDVQLSAGTIQFKDLALNADRINDKLGNSAALKVRDGSIGSLLVKIPWNCKNCMVEVDELELVFMPSADDTSCCDSNVFNSNQDGHTSNDSEGDNVIHILTTPVTDVHEGVKVVAEMVKALLESFHVKMRNVIVAVDPYLQKDDHEKESTRNAVLRIAEIECGTCFSSQDNSSGGVKVGDVFGIDLLTNFLTFKGAIVELLLVDKTENQMLETSAQCPKITPVLTGQHAGFSGNVKLSIPWQNGSLNTRKMDVGVSLDPVEVKLQPWIIKWFLLFLQTLENYDKNGTTFHSFHNTKDSVAIGLTSPTTDHVVSDVVQSSLGHGFCSSAAGSDAMVDDKLVHNCYPHLGGYIDSDVILENSDLILDWMPSSAGKSLEHGINEADLGASIDQFFECFDGMRNSQSLMGSSGMWNWTYSVFSAITAASSLASGSLYIPAEQPRVETNVRVTIAEVSIEMSLLDQDDVVMNGPCGDQIDIDCDIHYLVSRWQDVGVMVQVNPQECKVDATVKQIDLNDFISHDTNASVDKVKRSNNSPNSLTLLTQKLQDVVMGALPSSSFYPTDVSFRGCYIPSEVPLGISSTIRLRSENKDAVKARLLETYGSAHFQFTRSSRSSDECFKGPASFTVELPPFTFWVNVNFLEKLLGFLQKMQTFEINNAENSGACEVFEREHATPADSDLTGTLQGNISLPTARVIVCFPFKKGESCGSYASWRQFIALDFSSVSNFKKVEGHCAADAHDATWKKCFASASHSLSLNIAKVDVYLISLDSKSDDTGGINDFDCLRFSTDRVLSLTNIANHHSIVHLFWHGHVPSGAWVLKNAKLLATSDDLGTKTRIANKGYEFSYAATRRDTEDLKSQMRNDMILSSKFVVHVHLCSIEVCLSNSLLICLYDLLNEAMAALISKDEEPAYERKDAVECQLSVLVECDSVEVVINFDAMDCTKSPLQRELPGSWHKLKLNVQSFEGLSVYNLGDIRGCSFLWISHGEGRLGGSITGLPGEELLLISCSNSSMGRGDGEGSNRLSCSPAGSDIVYLFDPESLNSTSITVKCATIIAPGARLDWLDKICSFFSLQSTNSEENADANLLKNEPRDSMPRKSNFVFSLIDGGLSYEPLRNLKLSSTLEVEKENSESLVASFLAASSLKLSSATALGTSECCYNIRMKDLGLLLHEVSIAEKTDYSVEHLRKIGYVKVAMESFVEAGFRTNDKSDNWELNCSKSHITLNTCHDTTLGLMRFISQIQQLLAPDFEETALHLENKGNSVQQVPEGKFSFNPCISSSSSGTKLVDHSAPNDAGIIGLLDEIHEDAFVGSHGGDPLDVCESVTIKAELIDSYCLSDLRSLSELTLSNQFSDAFLKSRSLTVGNQGLCAENGVWYRNRPLEFVEEHISYTNGLAVSEQLIERNHSSGNCRKSQDSDRYKGRVSLSDCTVKWFMHAGSNWKKMGQSACHSVSIHGRDGSACLELLLSDVNIQYDIFPDGDVRVSRLCLSVKDFNLHDRSRNAPWKLILGYYHSKKHPRESSSNSLKLDLEAIRPNPLTPLEEYRLQIAVLPLSLHLHQSQLDFIIAFFLGNLPPVGASNPSDLMSTKQYDSECCPITEMALLPFIQKFDIWPVTIRVDYQPTCFDPTALSGGKYVELVNIVQWKGVELKLKHIHATGIYGWKNMSERIIGEWLEDISQNQIHKLLSGLPSIRSVVSVGSRAANLLSLPWKNYRKNQRLSNGIQRGTIAFLQSISVEALGLGVHLTGGAHDILLQVESIISRIHPSLPSPAEGGMKKVMASDQPGDALHGFHKAYENLSDGLGRSASALVHTPMKTYQRSGGSAALLSAIRGVPAAAIAPASAAAQALHSVLLGLRKSLGLENDTQSTCL